MAVQVRTALVAPFVQAMVEPVGWTKREVPVENIILSLSAGRIYEPGIKLKEF